MFKRILSRLLPLLLVFSFSLPGWTAEAPNGFGGIAWGTPLSRLTGMSVFDNSGQVKYYRRANDPLILGGATLKRLSYGFYQDKFYSVLIEFEGRGNFEKVKTFLLKNHGEAARIGGEGTNYMWRTADGASVSLKYSSVAQQGYVFYFHRMTGEQP